jgi:hypothetical protein
VWLNNTLQTLDAQTPTANITALIPTLAEADGAPEVDVHVTYVLQDALLGPRLAVGPGVNIPGEAAYFRRPAAAGRVRVLARRVRVRANAASTTLLDGNQVWLYNDDDGEHTYVCTVAIKVPSLNWRNRS